MNSSDFIFIAIGLLVIFLSLRALFLKNFKGLGLDEKSIQKLTEDEKLRRYMTIPLAVAGVLLIVTNYTVKLWKIPTMIILFAYYIWFCYFEIRLLKKIKE